MNKSLRIAIVMAALALAPANAASVLPDYAYDTVARTGLAEVADRQCRGIKRNGDQIEAVLLDMYRQLARDGYPVESVVAHLKTPASNARVERRIQAVFERHGTNGNRIRPACRAIRAEALADTALRSMMDISR